MQINQSLCISHSGVFITYSGASGWQDYKNKSKSLLVIYDGITAAFKIQSSFTRQSIQ